MLNQFLLVTGALVLDRLTLRLVCPAASCPLCPACSCALTCAGAATSTTDASSVDVRGIIFLIAAHVTGIFVGLFLTARTQSAVAPRSVPEPPARVESERPLEDALIGGVASKDSIRDAIATPSTRKLK